MRKSTKSKPILISTPLPDTFRHTAGYDEFSAGPPPTMGSRPIKPSEQKIKRRSLSHLRAKSVGLQESQQLVRTDSDARPGTAPGPQSTPINLSDPWNFGQRSGASQHDTLLRTKSMQAPPKIPELPKGSAAKGGPKHFDLLQAAVSKSKATAPPEPTRVSFDFYNERIATRNLMYYKLPKLSVNEDVAKVSITQGEDSASLTQANDAQRASFDAMRASRNAEVRRGRAACEGIGVEMPRAAIAEVSDTLSQPVHANTKGQDSLLSDPNTPQDIVPALNPIQRRRSKRRSARPTDLPPQLPSAAPGKPGPALPPADSLSPSKGSVLPPARKRSKTVPAVPIQDNVSHWRQIENSVILTLKPFEAGLNHPAATDRHPASSVSHHPSNNHRSTASRDQMSSSRTSSTSSAYVAPRTSTDSSRRNREKNKSHPRDLAMTSSNVDSGVVLSVRSASHKKVTPSRRAMDLTVEDPNKKTHEGDDNDYDVGIEEAVAQQADPVQILRASVVSAKNYVHMGGDNVVLGRILHHRPSRGLAQSEKVELRSTAGEVGFATQPEARDTTSASVEPHPPTPTSTSGSALQSPFSRTEGTSTSPTRSQPPSEPVTAAVSLEVPTREPAEARTDLPKSRNPGKSVPSAHDLQFVKSETTQPSPLKSATVEALHSTVPASGTASPAVTQQFSGVPPPSKKEGSTLQSPGIVARDFADAQRPPRVFPSEATSGFQLRMTHGTSIQIPRSNKSNALGGYILVSQEELERQSSELDRSIAIRKQAVAKALLKLQDAMAMPMWEETSVTGYPRASRKVPSHWRDLSIEDGSPIAPSAIFQKAKMPILTPPLSRHSTFSGQRGRALRESAERLINGAAEGPLAPSLRAALSDASFCEAQKEDSVTNATPPESPERPWLERRGRSDTALPRAKASHSRVGSAISTTSGTSAYSVPYHMVPARGSSMRDSESSAGDTSMSPKFHVGELGWQ